MDDDFKPIKNHRLLGLFVNEGRGYRDFVTKKSCKNLRKLIWEKMAVIKGIYVMTNVRNNKKYMKLGQKIINLRGK